MMKTFLFIITMSIVLLAQAKEETHLPDIGSSANAALSPEQAYRIGQAMLQELREHNMVSDDPELNEYLQALGYRIVANSEDPSQKFIFFIVESPEINAFAAPGGFIGVNAGLITTAENESELAAVLAHEVAHVTQKHLVRAYENIKNATIPIALAMLGALIAARSGSNSGDVAQAAVVGGTALLQQQAINFTRHNEYEADRIGISTLAASGFEPNAMANFFGRMSKALRANGDSVPELLRTHPVTTSRVSEAKDRAATIKRETPSKAEVAQAGDPGFAIFRERARMAGSKTPGDLVSFYQTQLADMPDTAQAWPALRYGLALALARSHQGTKAKTILRDLLRRQPAYIPYELAMAEAEESAREPEAALRRLAKLQRDYPSNVKIAIAYANQLLRGKSREQAKTAAAVLKPLIVDEADNPLALLVAYANACELAGEPVKSGLAHVEAALLQGAFSDALGQLNDLLKRSDVDYYQRAQIEARIAEVTPFALEQRRQRVPLE